MLEGMTPKRGRQILQNTYYFFLKVKEQGARSDQNLINVQTKTHIGNLKCKAYDTLLNSSLIISDY